MATNIHTTATSPEDTAQSAQLFCSLTGKPISPEEAYWAPPLITFRELITTIFRTLIQSPGSLGSIMLTEQPNVPYAQDARELLASRRTTEQAKLLGLLLLIVALVATPIVLLAMG